MSRMVNKELVSETSVAANVTSKTWVTKAGQRTSVQCVWTGTLVGTLTMEGSNDGGTTWSTITAASADLTTISPDGSAGDGIVGFSDVPGGQLRIVFTFTSGTGNLDVHLTNI